MAKKKEKEPKHPWCDKERAKPKITVPAKKRKKSGPAPDFTEDELATILTQAHGNVTHAAEAIGMCKRQLRRRVNNSAMLKEVMFHARDSITDIAEHQLMAVLHNPEHKNHWDAVKFALQTAGQHRGYTGQKIDLNISGQVEHKPDQDMVKQLEQKLEKRLAEEAAEIIDIEEEDE